MLSRAPDALFWLSRYTERAENNARMMDVNLQLMLDVQPLTNNQHWESIIFTLEDTTLFKKLYPEILGDIAENLGIKFFEKGRVFEGEDDRFPMLIVRERLHIKHQLKIDVHHARVVFRALCVAAQPKKCIGDSA